MRVMSPRHRSSERNLSEVPGRSLCPGWSRDVSGLWPRTGGECQPQRMSAMSSGNIFRPGPLRNLFFSILLERQHLYLAVLGVKPLTFNNFQLQFSHLNHSFLHLLLYRSRIIFTILFGQAAAAILCLIFPKRGKWFHLPSIAAGLLVLGLSLFLARHQVKKRRLRESQWRSDQVEMLLQEMDEALWNEQENAGLHLGGPKFRSRRCGGTTYSGNFRDIQGAVDFSRSLRLPKCDPS